MPFPARENLSGWKRWLQLVVLVLSGRGEVVLMTQTTIGLFYEVGMRIILIEN